MKKTIYNDDAYGFYSQEHFPDFMSRLEGVEDMGRNTLAPTIHSNGHESFIHIFHHVIHGVTIRYVNIATERVMGGDDVRVARVVLGGSQGSISEVEKIIIAASNSYSQ